MVYFDQQPAAQPVDHRRQQKSPPRFLQFPFALLDLFADQFAGIGFDPSLYFFDFGQYFLFFHLLVPILAKAGIIVKWKVARPAEMMGPGA